MPDLLSGQATLLKDLHLRYINSLDTITNASHLSSSYDAVSASYASFMTQHLRMGGVFWTVGSLMLMNVPLSDGLMNNPSSDGLMNDPPSDGLMNDPPSDVHTSTSAVKGPPSMFGNHTSSPCSSVASKEPCRKNTKPMEKIQEQNSSLHDLMEDSSIKRNVQVRQIDSSQLSTPKLSSALELDHCYVRSITTIRKASVLEFIRSCWDNEHGGYGNDTGHSAHITATSYALLTLRMLDAIDTIPNKDTLVQWIMSLQNKDGSFSGDKWGETDARFSYCAVSSLAVLNRLSNSINCSKAARWILSTANRDGAFGSLPNSESHAAYTFCCVAALKLLGCLGFVDMDRLGKWLSERQITNSANRGLGFNGRMEKYPDVCYSWWIYATLTLIEREHWIDREGLHQFILDSQDADDGGIADRPGDIPDIFHTFFGIAALSLLKIYPHDVIQPVDAAFALPVKTYLWVND